MYTQSTTKSKSEEEQGLDKTNMNLKKNLTWESKKQGGNAGIQRKETKRREKGKKSFETQRPELASCQRRELGDTILKLLT